MPETFPPTLLTYKARQLRLKTGRWELHSKCRQPYLLPILGNHLLQLVETKEFTVRILTEKNILRPAKSVTISYQSASLLSVLFRLMTQEPVVFLLILYTSYTSRFHTLLKKRYADMAGSWDVLYVLQFQNNHLICSFVIRRFTVYHRPYNIWRDTTLEYLRKYLALRSGVGGYYVICSNKCVAS